MISLRHDRSEQMVNNATLSILNQSDQYLIYRIAPGRNNCFYPIAVVSGESNARLQAENLNIDLKLKSKEVKFTPLGRWVKLESTHCMIDSSIQQRQLEQEIHHVQEVISKGGEGQLYQMAVNRLIDLKYQLEKLSSEKSSQDKGTQTLIQSDPLMAEFSIV